jgi:hypothetical protein
VARYLSSYNENALMEKNEHSKTNQTGLDRRHKSKRSK